MYRLHCTSKTNDHSIGQINGKTISRYKFNKKLLTTNLEYSVEAAAIVLSDFKKQYEYKEKYYWSRYNSSKPIMRAIYKLMVMRFM